MAAKKINHRAIFERLWNRSTFWSWMTDRNHHGRIYLNHEDPTMPIKTQRLPESLYESMSTTPIRWEFCSRVLLSNGTDFWVRDCTLEIQQQMRLIDAEKFYEPHLAEVLHGEQIRQVVDSGWIARPLARTTYLAKINANRPMELLHLGNFDDQSRQWFWRKLHADKPWMPAGLRQEISAAGESG